MPQLEIFDGTNWQTIVNSITLNQSIFNATAAMPKRACHCVTTTRLEVISGITSLTYSNGTSGVGATLSLTMQAGYNFIIDGYWVNTGDRILVTSEPLYKYNGIYTLTTSPTASTIILTRATDYDSVGKINALDYIDIWYGTVGSGRRYVQVMATPTIIGTSDILFSSITAPKDCLLTANNFSDINNVVNARYNLNVYALGNPTGQGLSLSLDQVNMVATFELNAELKGLAALGVGAGGIVARTNIIGNYVTRAIAVGTGLSVVNGSGILGDPTISLTTQLQNLSNLATNGIMARTAANTFASRLIAVGAGLSITNADGISGNPTISLSTQLQNLNGLNTVGFVSLSNITTDTFVNRILTAGTGLSITNGDGVSGNPTIALSNTAVTSGTYASPSSLTVNAQGQITNITAGSTPITSLTLTGAVTGSGSSSIATTLGNTQTIVDNLTFNSSSSAGNTTNTTTVTSELGQPSVAYGVFERVIQKTTTNGDVRKLTFRLGFSGSTGAYNDTFALRYTLNNTTSNIFLYSQQGVTLSIIPFVLLSSGLDLGGNKITNVGAPVATLDAVNKGYADSLITAQLSALSTLSTTGIMARTAANTFATRTLTASTGISITNGNGVSGNPTIAIGTVPIANLSGYSSTGTNFLRQDGTWTKPLMNDLLINGDVSISTYNFTTSGTISASTGALKANNLMVHNSTAIVCDPLAVTGGYAPYNGNYGYLNSSGGTGTASGTNTYSINATYRIKASEFNAVSSIKKKRIVSQGLEIEKEVVDIIKKTEFFKYEYKDQIAEKGIRYGVIAEELGKVLPDYVDYNNMEYILNIEQVGKVQKIKDCQYIIKLENEIDNTVKINRLKLINNKNKVIEVEISDIIDLRTLKINSKENLSQKVFVYGTYEECPSVANKVTELALIAVKNLLTRVEKLEEIQYE